MFADWWSEKWASGNVHVAIITLALLLVAFFLFFLPKRRKKMGGVNESVLEGDKGGKKKSKDEAGAAGPGQGGPPGNMLKPDQPPSAPANTIPANLPTGPFGVPMQTQAIRQHMSNGQVHLHVDAQNLKTAVPVAEWYVIMRHLKSLTPFTFVDSDNKSVAYFRPYISGGTFEVAIELAAINVGPRIQDMTNVTARK